jgi:pectate lyase
VRDKIGTSRVAPDGPWPDFAAGAAAPPPDSDHDGILDAWEKSHGLDPADPKDGPKAAASGYTKIENYHNELAGDPLP